MSCRVSTVASIGIHLPAGKELFGLDMIGEIICFKISILSSSSPFSNSQLIEYTNIPYSL